MYPSVGVGGFASMKFPYVLLSLSLFLYLSLVFSSSAQDCPDAQELQPFKKAEVVRKKKRQKKNTREEGEISYIRHPPRA